MVTIVKMSSAAITVPRDSSVPVIVQFQNGATLSLMMDEGEFVGYEPHKLLRITYFADGFACQSEYFPENALEFALDSLEARANSSNPMQATLRSPSLESLLILKPEVAEKRRQASADLAAHAKHFVLPKVSHMEPIPRNENPFWHDSFNMGTSLVRGWTIMHGGFDREESPRRMDYLILINGRTGQRIKVVPQPPTQYTYRSLPCTDSPDDWCVSGKTRDGASGVLEWCRDQKDAEEMFRTMREHDDFTALSVCRFNNPESTTYSWEEFK